MICIFNFIIIFWITLCCTRAENTCRSFPENFLFGVATAAFQIEGGWDADGKSPSIWDHAARADPKFIQGGVTGKVACDSYHKIRRDVEMIRELGVDYYRFSISWPRILPDGFANRINKAGVEYYTRLLDELLKYDIEPMVTMYHWDLPQVLQDHGGWASPLSVQWFEDYARVLFKSFGHKVKLWVTFNEPTMICLLGYGTGLMAPRLVSPGIGEYMCSRNVLMAHAKAWRLYNEKYRAAQMGSVGIAVNFFWYEPATDREQDVKAAEDLIEFHAGQFVHPIFSEAGNFPTSMRARVASRSQDQGYVRSRLPELTEAEVDLIKGTADFLGVNHYTTYYVYRNASVPEGTLFISDYGIPSFMDDVYAATFPIPGTKQGSSKWLFEVPRGFYSMLNYIRKRYNNPHVFITENGYSDYGGRRDEDRVRYLRLYLNALLDALEAGCRVRGYTVWSLMDNLEWISGFTEKFGLYQVDFRSPSRNRTAKKSALVYKDVVKTHQINSNYEPIDLDITIDED